MQKRLPVAALALMLCAAPAFAQPGSPNTTPGTVTRVTLVRIKPGHADPFWQDVRQHLKPILDEYKQKGILTNYTVGTKPTIDNPDDWNVVLTQSYANWAVLDNLGPRTDPITLAHYGSAANRTAALMARLEHSTTVVSFLVRDQAINPWK